MKFVYLLESQFTPKLSYIGITSELNQALIKHNKGHIVETREHLPWKVSVAVRFDDHERATRFRDYLLTRSGKTHIKRHLLQEAKVLFQWPESKRQAPPGPQKTQGYKQQGVVLQEQK